MKTVYFETEKLPSSSCEVIAITKEGLRKLQYRHSLKEFGEDQLQGVRSHFIWQKCDVMGWASVDDPKVA